MALSGVDVCGVLTFFMYVVPCFAVLKPYLCKEFFNNVKIMDNRYATKDEIRSFYSEKVETLSAEIRQLKKHNRVYIASELMTFGLAVVSAVVYCVRDFSSEWLMSAFAMLAVYVVVRRADVKNGRRIDKRVRLCGVYARELKYMSGDYSCFSGGSRYIDPHHAFTFDMDVFGHDSLYNRIDRTVTTGGGDALADWLGSLLPDKAAVERRRAAVDELADMEKWRSEFMATGARGQNAGAAKGRKIDSGEILRAVTSVGDMHIAPKAGLKSTLAVAVAAIICFAVLIVLSIIGVVPATLPVLWGVVQMFVVIGLNSRSIHDISRAVEKLHANLHVYIEIIRHIEGAGFKSDELNGLKDRLADDGGGALVSFGKLSEILNALDRRGNFIGLVIFNMFAMSDYFLVRRFLKWQNDYMRSIGGWVDCVSRIDALVSMGTFRFNEPKAVDAVVLDSGSVVYEAKGLYHPFLGDAAVRNDFTVNDGEYYIITGANMAGKSTFLRSVGVNYILAMNGMPVFADSLRVSAFGLFTSMRTSDDLSRGISYFNAELLRLKQLLDNCRNGGRTLIILDEILKGTNSLDKLNGSRLFLQAVAELPVTGIIATHDLELSKMEDDNPQRFHNWCFEIELADNITYTYKITRGVARNQNATFLLKGILRG